MLRDSSQPTNNPGCWIRPMFSMNLHQETEGAWPGLTWFGGQINWLVNDACRDDPFFPGEETGAYTVLIKPRRQKNFTRSSWSSTISKFKRICQFDLIRNHLRRSFTFFWRHQICDWSFKLNWVNFKQFRTGRNDLILTDFRPENEVGFKLACGKVCFTLIQYTIISLMILWWRLLGEYLERGEIV